MSNITNFFDELFEDNSKSILDGIALLDPEEYTFFGFDLAKKITTDTLVLDDFHSKTYPDFLSGGARKIVQTDFSMNGEPMSISTVTEDDYKFIGGDEDDYITNRIASAMMTPIRAKLVQIIKENLKTL